MVLAIVAECVGNGTIRTVHSWHRYIRLSAFDDTLPHKLLALLSIVLVHTQILVVTLTVGKVVVEKGLLRFLEWASLRCEWLPVKGCCVHELTKIVVVAAARFHPAHLLPTTTRLALYLLTLPSVSVHQPQRQYIPTYYPSSFQSIWPRVKQNETSKKLGGNPQCQ
jgi:hypothetical protein